MTTGNSLKRTLMRALLFSAAGAALTFLSLWAGTASGLLPSVIKLGGAVLSGKRLRLLLLLVHAAGLIWVLAGPGLERDVECKLAFTVCLPLSLLTGARLALISGSAVSAAAAAVYMTAGPAAVCGFQIRDILRDDMLREWEKNEWAVEELRDLVHHDLMMGPLHFTLTAAACVLLMPGALSFAGYAETALLCGGSVFGRTAMSLF